MPKFLWHEASNDQGLDPVTQVSGFCFDEHGNVLLLRQTDVPDKQWNIPGGHPEKGEMPSETLKREIYEETAVHVGKHGLIGYQEVHEDSGQTHYQLRFAALIESIGPQKIDPAKGVIHKRLFVKPDEVMNYVIYPQYREALGAAVKWYKQHKAKH